MGVRNASVASTTMLTSNIITTAETALVTTPPINLPIDNAGILIFASVNVTPGTATTTLAVRLRRGSGITGTQLNAGGPYTVLVTTAYFINLTWFDSPGIVAGQQYTLTVQQAAATGNGTAFDGSIVAMVL